MSIYKLAATGAGGTENGIAQLDVQFDGIITAIAGAMESSITAGGDKAAVEVSFLSVNTLGTNDQRGSLFAMRQQIFVGAAGTILNSTHHAIGGLAIAVASGERVWLHYVATAARIIVADVHIYVEDGQGIPTAPRRR